MKRDVLVIKPPYDVFPLGIAYVLSCLEESQITFDFVDISLQPDYLSYLQNHEYSAVTTGGLIGFFPFFREVCNNVRKFQPNAKIILGGNITKDIREDFLFDKIGTDYGIIGEAETSLPHLISSIITNSPPLDKVPGIIYRELNGTIVKNRPNRLDLSSQNIIPAWHHIDVEYYISRAQIPLFGKIRFFPILTGRGCIGRCSFCSPTIGRYMKRPIPHVMEEMRLFSSRYSFDMFVVYTEMMYPTKEEIAEFCKAYQDLKLERSWGTQIRVDADVDLATFKIMKDSGCIMVSAGIESGSDKILRIMHKQTTKEQIVSFFTFADLAGIASNGTFMIGNEGETEEDLAMTIEMVTDERINSDYSLVRTYPGTLIYKHAVKKGLIHDEWEYLHSLLEFPGLFSRRSDNYINISDIPDKDFWQVVTREARKFYQKFNENFQLSDPVITFGNLVVRIEGICQKCSERYSRTLFSMETRKLFQIIDYCPHCHYPVSIIPYAISPVLREHREKIANNLREKNTILISGEYSDVIKTNLFDLDYSAVIGVVDLNHNKPGSFAGDKAVFSLQEISQLNPDLILIADGSLNADNELRIIMNQVKNGAKCPIILHTLPSGLMRVHMITNFIVRLSGKPKSRRLKIILLKYGIFLVKAVSYSHLLLSWLKKKENRKKIRIFIKPGLSLFLRKIDGNRDSRGE